MLTDKEIKDIGKKYQGKAKECLITEPRCIHYDIQFLLDVINELMEVIEMKDDIKINAPTKPRK